MELTNLTKNNYKFVKNKQFFLILEISFLNIVKRVAFCAQEIATKGSLTEGAVETEGLD